MLQTGVASVRRTSPPAKCNSAAAQLARSEAKPSSFWAISSAARAMELPVTIVLREA